MKTKRTVAMILSLLMLTALPLAFSAEETTSTAASSIVCTPNSNAAAGGQRQARMGQSAAIGSTTRAGMLEKRSQMMQNRASNLGSSAQSLQLCAKIDQAITAIQAKGETLPAETLAQVQKLKDQVVALHGELAATRGDIRSLMTQYREFRQAKDFESMDAIFTQITALQTLRADKIAAINSLLAQILSLLPAA